MSEPAPECLIAWWDEGASYMDPHVCIRPENHDGRHTCKDKGCRSWRPGAAIGGDDG